MQIIAHTYTHPITTESPCRNLGLSQVMGYEEVAEHPHSNEERLLSKIQHMLHLKVEQLIEIKHMEAQRRTYRIQVFLRKNQDVQKKEIMLQCRRYSQHAAAAPGAISCHNNISHSIRRGGGGRRGGTQRDFHAGGENIRASDSDLPCIVLSPRSSRALQCQLHKHHSNSYTKSFDISEFGISQKKKKKKQWRGSRLMWK